MLLSIYTPLIVPTKKSEQLPNIIAFPANCIGDSIYSQYCVTSILLNVIWNLFNIRVNGTILINGKEVDLTDELREEIEKANS